jgi:hypothetical protein
MMMLQGVLIVIDANALISYQVLACAVFCIFRKGAPLLVFHFSTFLFRRDEVASRRLRVDPRSG